MKEELGGKNRDKNLLYNLIDDGSEDKKVKDPKNCLGATQCEYKATI